MDIKAPRILILKHFDVKIKELESHINKLSFEEPMIDHENGPSSYHYERYTEAALFIFMTLRIERYNELHERLATLRAHKTDILAFQATADLIGKVMSRPMRVQLKQILNGDT